MTTKQSNRFFWFSVIALPLLLGSLIFAIVKTYTITSEKNEIATQLRNLRQITSTPVSVNLKEVLKRDTIVIQKEGSVVEIFRNKYVDNPELKRQLVKQQLFSDSTINNLRTALNLKEKQINEISILHTRSIVENKQLKAGKNNIYSYKDQWLTIEYDDSIKAAKTIQFKADLGLVNNWERKNFFYPKRYYTQVTSNSPYFNIDSIKSIKRKSPSTVFSMYIDNRYYNNFDMNNGFMINTLNVELNNQRTVSFLGGVGFETNTQYINPIWTAGLKINLWRIKK